LQEQAEKFGTEVLLDDVTSVDFSGDIKKVSTGYSGDFEAQAVIFSTGSAYRKLGLDDEERLSGRGVSWCATCDGFFFKKKTIAVIGGGDSAMEEATFLTRFADKVYLIHRKDTLRASKIMQERAFANEKIEFVFNSAVVGINGENTVESLKLENTVTGELSELPVQGLFVAIGNDPRTHLVHGQLDLTASGTIAVAGRSSKTNIAGVFAAGDVIDDTYRQAATAAASGTVAALDAEHYLAGLAEASAIAELRDAEAEIELVESLQSTQS
ncbi:MAG: thioredoxin reductase, partial [Subtercola sp.]|nr:thioredoxin reductase [Subtercola sp.]